MAFAPVMGPSGGPIRGCDGSVLSGFWSDVMNSLRLVLGVAFEAREVIFIAARDGMARHEPVHRLAHQARHGVVAAHPHNRFRRTLGRRRVESLQLPAFQTNYAVTIS